MEIQIDISLVLAVICAMIFGIGYNGLINLAHKHAPRLMDAYTSLTVVGGVIVTVAIAITKIGFENALWVGLFFVCTGTPMIIGNMVRYVTREHENERRQVRGE